MDYRRTHRTVNHDRHHAFTNLAARYPWLAHLERRVRNARPRDRRHLHNGFDYIRRQTSEIERQQKVQRVHIPGTFDFEAVPQLRMEAREKLTRVRPRDLGQAGRISGITPVDLAVLMISLKEANRNVS